MKLSVIIPFRCENSASHYIVERLEELSSKLEQDSDVEFLVVDSGSSEDYSLECQNICNKNKIIYLYEDTRGQTFSISSARDFGVRHARGDVVTFLDVDWRFKKGFFKGVLELIDLWGISKYKKSFLSIPALYLSENGAKQYKEANGDERILQQFYIEFLRGENSNIETLAPFSSIILVDRIHYLSIGGHSKEFRGHGYEDFELTNRLIQEENILPEANNYTRDTKSWTRFTYNGFRSEFSILGRPALMLNLLVFHLWHPRPKSSSFYNPKKMAENRNRIIDCFNDFKKNRKHPAPLISTRAQFKKVGYFSSFNSNTFNMLRDIFPILGDPICLDEQNIVNDDSNSVDNDLMNLIIKSNNIELFLFPNPYGNSKRLSIYNWCIENKFPFLCVDRGALPNSWFFDPYGCNGDSASYCNYKKSTRLNLSDLQSTEKYIYNCINGENYLEKQGNRIGGEALLERLKIHGQKVFFIPLQRPSDSVIKYFCGDVESYENFLQVVDQLAGELKKLGWVTLAKKHPLETIKPEFDNITLVSDDTNFVDLIDASSAVGLINSGVGVYAMMLQKPCYIFGKAFYSINNVNIEVSKDKYSTIDAITNFAKEIAKSKFLPDRKEILLFISYLINDFYSFGISKIKNKKEEDGSLRTLTTNIDFYKINVLGYHKVYEMDVERKIYLSAPLFERYGLDIHEKNAEKDKSKIQNQKKTTSEKKNIKTAVPNKVIKNSTFVPTLAIENTSINSKKSRKLSRKWNKFLVQPYSFCNDSKSPFIRPFRVFFKKM